MNNKEIRPVDTINLTKESIITDKREIAEYRTELKMSVCRKWW